MAKRILKYTSLFLAVVFLLLICWFFFGGALCNDLKAWRIERSFSSMALPESTDFIETASFVGNTSGAGNLTEIRAGMLIRSDLSEAELAEYFEGYEIYAVPADLTENNPYPKDFIAFQSLNGKSSGYGYYVISNSFNAFTQMDLRGH